MKNRIMILMILTFIYNIAAFTTEYPELIDTLSGEWQQAGLSGSIPVHHPETVLDASNVASLQAIIDGITDAAIDNIHRIILPPGEFVMTNPINLRSYIILKGNHEFRRDEDRSQRTILKFNLATEDNCINVTGSEDIPIEYVGIEDLWIIRDENGSTENSGHGLNMNFQYSSNCWVIGVESTNPVSNHLRMINSEHNYVAGCYFDDAQNHGEGGNGYGVFIEYDSHHILVENNIFRKLRHSMVVQNGAHHNVFGYNTVKKSKNTSIEDWNPSGVAPWMEDFCKWLITSIVPDDYTGDLLCHGESSQHYDGTYEGPYENLFEGNICNSIQVDSFWGRNKKHNTFFRNKSSKYGLAVYPKLPGYLDKHAESEKQTEQITINNYGKSKQHWTDAGPLYMTAGGGIAIGNAILRLIPIYGEQLAINLTTTVLKATMEYASFGYKLTNGRGFDVKPIEKNNIIKRMDFWGNYYTRTWTSDHYGTEAKAWNDESYYCPGMPYFWATSLESSWPYHPKNSDSIPSEFRYNAFDKKTVSRYDDASYLQTYYITQDTVIPDDLVDDLRSLTGNLRVPENTMLIIDSSSSTNGITLKFERNKLFGISGAVKVIGTENKPVTFTNLQPTLYDNDRWYGVYIGKEARTVFDDSSFEWAIFENAKGSSTASGGAFNFDNNYSTVDYTVTFNNCIFRNNISKRHNPSTNQEDGDGGAIFIKQRNDDDTIITVFNNCRFLNNTSESGGGAICAWGAPPIIQNCYFENNQAGSGGAIYIRGNDDYRDVIIAGNVFNNNSANNFGAISIRQNNFHDSSSYNTIIQNNTFVNNTATGRGGAVSLLNDSNSVYFINNIFRDNEAEGTSEVSGVGHSILYYLHNDLLNNHEVVFESNSIEGFNLIDDPSNDYISYASFNDAYNSNMNLNYTANNNIDSDPLICNSYKIDTTSPCFDSGYLPSENGDDIVYYSLSKDIDGNNRIARQSIDIGAFEYNDIYLNIDTPEITLGNINPDSPREFKFEVLNTSNNKNITNIEIDVSEDLEDVLIFDSYQSELNPNSSMTIIGNFYPTKMYKSYNGFINIKSDDIMNTDISIPFSANTHIHSGWNWVSFPIASGSMDNNQLFETINPYGISIMYKNDYATLDNNNWSINGLDTIYSSAFYKINMTDYSNQYDIPYDMENTQTSITLYPDVDNWVGYWLDESKDMRDAFGDNFEKVTSMKSEKWSYAPIPINPKGGIDISTPPSWKTHTLHKGRGYIVRVSETIQGFRWSNSGSYYKKNAAPDLTQYEFKATDEYIVMDIVNIDDSVIEIGAFQDNVCIGAVAVVDNQAQLLLYPSIETKIESNIRLEFASVDKRSTLRDFYTYDFKENRFKISQDVILNKSYYLISPEDPNIENNVSAPILKLYSNYPNPFNPETVISFDLPCDSEVKLDIYNIRGQKVKTLTDGKLSAGNHRIVWNGTNSNNKSVASGVYFSRLKTSGKELTKKMILLK